MLSDVLMMAQVAGGKTLVEVIAEEPMLWVIAICSIVCFGITFERFMTMRKANVDSDALLRSVGAELDKNNVDGAIELCDKTGGPVGETLSIGLRKLVMLERLGKQPEEVEEGIQAAMEEHGIHVISFLERNLSTLATMASLGPILGMIGTVFGMIIEFSKVGSGSGSATSGLGAGISMALYCTAGGLIVAAFGTLQYNYFASRVNAFAIQVQGAAGVLVEKLLHSQSNKRHGKSQAPVVAPAPAGGQGAAV